MKYFSDSLTHEETVRGYVYLALSLLLIPGLLQGGNALLASPLSDGTVNFIYYTINFVAVLSIFRRFLSGQFKSFFRMLLPALWYAVLGYLGSRALGNVLDALLYALYPSFLNVNDQSITQMLGTDFYLMVIGTVVLVPIVEEVFYRGLFFRGLYGKSDILAYLVSMGVFAAIHVVGYIGVYPPLQLFFCFLQYLPAGFCLAWCYRETGTIFTPITMHMIVNAAGVSQYLR